MLSSRNALGFTTSDPIRQYANQPRLPVGRCPVPPNRCGMNSTVMPIRSAITKFWKFPYSRT